MITHPSSENEARIICLQHRGCLFRENLEPFDRKTSTVTDALHITLVNCRQFIESIYRVELHDTAQGCQ